MWSTQWQRIAAGIVMGIVLLATAAWSFSQTPKPPNQPVVLAGEDIGFRMTGRRGTSAIGVLVVRIDGQWVPAESSLEVKRITE